MLVKCSIKKGEIIRAYKNEQIYNLSFFEIFQYNHPDE